PDSVYEIRSVQTGAQALGLKLVIFNASTAAEIEAAFDRIAELRPDALLVGTDLFSLRSSGRRLLRGPDARRFRPSIHFVSMQPLAA
ncbi:MAG: hypothetical protein WCC81_13495, partial [Pseudolabrys sp.]